MQCYKDHKKKIAEDVFKKEKIFPRAVKRRKKMTVDSTSFCFHFYFAVR